MTDSLTTSMSTPDTASASSGPSGRRPSPWRVVRDQRKTELVALVMMIAPFWIFGPLGRWQLAGCIAGGVFLGLLNHLYTEYWLLKIIESGAQPTRNQMIAATISRLAVLTVVAVGVAGLFWPDGIALLLGLAIFRLIALVMTGLPLLKELKSQ
jgi:hypothetical protein